ncbi:hypothetical protein [Saccharothrix stipae]
MARQTRSRLDTHPLDHSTAATGDDVPDAARGSDFEGLPAILDPDVVLRADSGSVPHGGLRVLRGADAVAGWPDSTRPVPNQDDDVSARISRNDRRNSLERVSLSVPTCEFNSIHRVHESAGDQCCLTPRTEGRQSRPRRRPGESWPTFDVMMGESCR